MCEYYLVVSCWTHAHSNNYWQCQKISSLAEDKFGEGALSFSDSKSDKRKNKTNWSRKWCQCSACYQVVSCWSHANSNNYWQCQKISVLCREKIGVGALGNSDSKSKKRTRKKRSHFATIAFQQLKCQTDKLSALNFFAVQTHRIWYY